MVPFGPARFGFNSKLSARTYIFMLTTQDATSDMISWWLVTYCKWFGPKVTCPPVN